jgi:hypothetical protein
VFFEIFKDWGIELPQQKYTIPLHFPLANHSLIVWSSTSGITPVGVVCTNFTELEAIIIWFCEEKKIDIGPWIQNQVKKMHKALMQGGGV